MDGDRLAGRRHTGVPDRYPTEFSALHDWLAEDALASARTAEDELAIDWRRHCDRLRHEHPRSRTASSRRGTDDVARPLRTGTR